MTATRTHREATTADADFNIVWGDCIKITCWICHQELPTVILDLSDALKGWAKHVEERAAT